MSAQKGQAREAKRKRPAKLQAAQDQADSVVRPTEGVRHEDDPHQDDAHAGRILDPGPLPDVPDGLWEAQPAPKASYPPATPLSPNPEQQAQMYALQQWLSPMMPLAALLEQAWLAGYGSRPHLPDVPQPLGAQIDPTWISVIHRYGEHPCEGTALYVTHRPDPTRPGKLEMLRIWARPRQEPGDPPGPYHWRAPFPDDAPVCATCGQPINPYTNDQLDWRTVYGV